MSYERKRQASALRKGTGRNGGSDFMAEWPSVVNELHAELKKFPEFRMTLDGLGELLEDNHMLEKLASAERTGQRAFITTAIRSLNAMKNRQLFVFNWLRTTKGKERLAPSSFADKIFIEKHHLQSALLRGRKELTKEIKDQEES